MLKYEAFYSAHILSAYASVARQTDCRLQPELALTIWSSNMNVCWFMALVRVKMEPERSNS